MAITLTVTTEALLRRVQLSGITREFAERLGEDVWRGEWDVPSRTELIGQKMHYSVEVGRRVDKIDQDLLDRFLRLATSSDKKIEAFARRYGPLHPAVTHQLLRLEAACGSEFTSRSLVPDHGGEVSDFTVGGIGEIVEKSDLFAPTRSTACEEIAEWRAVAVTLELVVRAAIDLFDGNAEAALSSLRQLPFAMLSTSSQPSSETSTLSIEIWPHGSLHFDGSGPGGWIWGPTEILAMPDAERLVQFVLQRLIDNLLDLGRAGLSLMWTAGRPTMQPVANSLLGALALQLAELVSGSRRSALCFHCHSIYEPRRLPKPGERAFCPECKHRANAYRQQDSRDRRRTRRAGQ